MMKKAVFIDRDGTINQQVDGYLTSWSDFKFLPGVLDALKTIAGSDYKIMVVTNQSAVGRGMLDVGVLEEIHERMLAEVEGYGGRIDAVYVCMHAPEDGCSCRKPGVGLLRLAEASFDLDLSSSWMVGDKTTDILTGVNAGCHTLLVETGYGGGDGLYDVEPEFSVSDLGVAVSLILKN
ncbi:MAG: HAD family hydrolase [Candidatus Altiarchaeota archaeon]